MNTTPFVRPRGFGFGPTIVQHQQNHPDALAWATFALVLLLVLTVGAMIVARFAGRRSRRWRGPGAGRGHRHFAFAGAGPRHDPLDVLRWRYARGEIGRDEFLQGTGDLTARGEAPPPAEPPAV